MAFAVAFGLVGAALPSVGLAEYHLAPGDVIEVAVASVPELGQRARVDSEGEVSLAYLGQLKAAGRPIIGAARGNPSAPPGRRHPTQDGR
jgi:polysaccharide biosynthesis/export protein